MIHNCDRFLISTRFFDPVFVVSRQREISRVFTPKFGAQRELSERLKFTNAAGVNWSIRGPLGCKGEAVICKNESVLADGQFCSSAISRAADDSINYIWEADYFTISLEYLHRTGFCHTLVRQLTLLSSKNTKRLAVWHSIAPGKHAGVLSLIYRDIEPELLICMVLASFLDFSNISTGA